MKHFWKSISWALLIIILSIIPSSSIQKSALLSDLLSYDKLLHMLFYTIMYLILWNDFIKKQYKPQQSIIKASLLTWFLGFSAELLQLILPIGRRANYVDIIANSVGIIIGVLISYFAMKFYKKRSN